MRRTSLNSLIVTCMIELFLASRPTSESKVFHTIYASARQAALTLYVPPTLTLCRMC